MLLLLCTPSFKLANADASHWTTLMHIATIRHIGGALPIQCHADAHGLP